MKSQVNQRILFVVICSFLAGCEKPATTSKPATVSYEVTFFHREMSPSGPTLISGKTASLKVVSITSKTEVGNLGLKATVEVKSIEQGTVTFLIVLPDDKSQEAEMKDGETKEFFAEGRASGVRIQINQISS